MLDLSILDSAALTLASLMTDQATILRRVEQQTDYGTESAYQTIATNVRALLIARPLGETPRAGTLWTDADAIICAPVGTDIRVNDRIVVRNRTFTVTGLRGGTYHERVAVQALAREVTA
jgi:hypothetical protein